MFELATIEEKPWVSADVLADALEYGRTKNLIDLYRSNRGEFTENDVLEVLGANRAEINGPGRPAKETYFSEDGAVLLCMFARTDKAKEIRKLIREVFMNWYRGRKSQLPAAQGELFPPAVKVPQAQVKIDQKKGLVTLTLPVTELHRLGALSGDAAPALNPPEPSQAVTGLTEPDNGPNLRYDFAAGCQGMHGWYMSHDVAEAVGCAPVTVHNRINQDRLPPGWGSQFKHPRWWVYIP